VTRLQERVLVLLLKHDIEPEVIERIIDLIGQAEDGLWTLPPMAA